jgi:hypothetical protein
VTAIEHGTDLSRSSLSLQRTKILELQINTFESASWWPRILAIPWMQKIKPSSTLEHIFVLFN